MSENHNFGFGKFVPGFDFLQNLAKGATQGLPQVPNLSSWVAPTLNVEELDKRIGELKAVHFWLDQNSKALGATIQALEVQKMTLATLRGMNFNMAEVADALRMKTAETLQKAGEMAAGAAARPAADDTPAPEAADPAPEEAPAPRRPASRRKSADRDAAAASAGAGGTGVVDPLQWWGALTQQFQQIATDAMKDAAAQTALDTARNVAGGMAREAVKAATGMAKAATGRAAPAPKKRAAAKAAKAPARRRPAARTGRP
ncbi:MULTISPECIES: PhaM family polyhydroxyalkanoate granule multifunctional regulatory protein [Ramlibacter]|uniref:Transcriptional regulator n=1 Tax=Ramlibacter aquaticus TaxID=2780094 RepID=A0ABR9SBM0_9BURK|nr:MULTISPECIES: PhaM family polyhydroxyalkanoate granule multifunctional regulatory protein [Ramlibacter]MBE7939746.1 hypothetical protein [Ramlibacter aquaticus]